MKTTLMLAAIAGSLTLSGFGNAEEFYAMEGVPAQAMAETEMEAIQGQGPIPGREQMEEYCWHPLRCAMGAYGSGAPSLLNPKYKQLVLDQVMLNQTKTATGAKNRYEQLGQPKGTLQDRFNRSKAILGY